MDSEILARVQFAFTIMFHYIYPPLSIGLGVVLVIMEALWLKTGNPKFHNMGRFWTRIFALTFAIGVATGIVMEFEFGTNWATYSRFVGDIFGSALAAEGIFAFFLESGFLAILLFGWNKVGPRLHFFSTVMVCLGARFDDRVTGRLDAFSPGSIKIHVDIDRSSMNKTVRVDLPIVADVGTAMRQMIDVWKGRKYKKQPLDQWWSRIAGWRAVDCLSYPGSTQEIMPQYAIERLFEATKDKAPIITTEVGQHQMWAAQHFHFDAPNKWLTSGGLGTMGYGLPAAIGAQMGDPDALVIDIAGEASIQMNIQEMATATQYRLPVKVFILNNEWMGMVRQWQELTYESRYSESYSDSLPDFVALAEAYGWKGIRCDDPAKLDDAIAEMLAYDGPVMFDCRVHKTSNCFPMIPSGAAHTDMILSADQVSGTMDDEAKALV
jgi:acetolactate synthase-1/2/3 large subunit